MPDNLTPSAAHLLASYYDAVPYDSHPFPQTAPEHLQALAFLFGLQAPAPAQARVLELGCAAGGNVLPFAARHAGASALGVDLSAVQVAHGNAAIAYSGLSNVELRALDITQIDASFGRFDYIVCHGVYSWVPPEVQQAILRVCAQNLTPDGVAYVSYNVYPGWKAREIVRDAMILRGGARDAPEEKLAYARGMLDFLEESAREGSVLKKTLEETMPIVRGGNASYLLHEFLEPCNAPCYFKDFVARAESEGLAYLADAEPSTMFVQNYGEKVREPLMRECGGSQILMEQYLDFLVNRTFRQSLLVNAERRGQVKYRLEPERLRQLQFAGVFRAVDGTPLQIDASEQTCDALRNLKVTLRQPAHKALAQTLDERYPASASVDFLLHEVASRMHMAQVEVEPIVMAMLEELLIVGALRVRLAPAATPVTVPERPMALAGLRRAPTLALSAGETAMSTNQWHEPTALTPVERCLLPLLDGDHDHAALARQLVDDEQAGRIRFVKSEAQGHPEAQGVEGEAERLAFAQHQTEVGLVQLRRKGMLVD
ncbi:MAG: class I SAM-dependent methyltransferase [Variovorax sp.]